MEEPDIPGGWGFNYDYWAVKEAGEELARTGRMPSPQEIYGRDRRWRDDVALYLQLREHKKPQPVTNIPTEKDD